MRYGKEADEFGAKTIAPIYGFMHRMREEVLAYEVKSFVHLGTPEAYGQYLRAHEEPPQPPA